MEWEGREQSENVEDRRGMGPGAKAGIAVGGGAGLLLLLLGALTGFDFSKFLGQGDGGEPPRRQREFTAEEERNANFTRVILKDTEVIWDRVFSEQLGKSYKKPTLVLFTDVVESACGTQESAVGPFYCPGDSKVYIDLSFYTELEKKLRSPGEFARAYVIAHEVGHHVQRELGYSARVDDARDQLRQRRITEAQYNQMSVRLELQADFLSGVWAHHANETRGLKLTDKDIKDALNAARQIGDDTLQQRAGGRVRPESFNHGTSDQREAWLRYGLRTGDVNKARLLFDLPYSRLMPPRE